MQDKGISIYKVLGGTPEDAADLKGCYFAQTGTPGLYLFFDQSGDQISTEPSPLSSGTDFTFTLPTVNDVTWQVTNFKINGNDANGKAKGSWSTPPEEDEGTFQAQAGTGVDEDENASSATA